VRLKGRKEDEENQFAMINIYHKIPMHVLADGDSSAHAPYFFKSFCSSFLVTYAQVSFV